MITLKKTGEKLTINVFGVICDYDDVVKEICEFTTNPSKIEEIEVIIDTFGGDVSVAFAVANAVKGFARKKSALVVGSCMSAGVIILFSCLERKAYENTFFMVHSTSSFAFGNSQDFENAANDLKTYDGVYTAEILKSCTDEKRVELLSYYKSENIFSAQKAAEFGLITQTLDDAQYPRFAASFSPIEKLTKEIFTLQGEKKELSAIIEKSRGEISAQAQTIENLTLQARNNDNPQIPVFAGAKGGESKDEDKRNELKRILNLN